MGLFMANTKTSISEKPRNQSLKIETNYTCIVNTSKRKPLFRALLFCMHCG